MLNSCYPAHNSYTPALLVFKQNPAKISTWDSPVVSSISTLLIKTGKQVRWEIIASSRCSVHLGATGKAVERLAEQKKEWDACLVREASVPRPQNQHWQNENDFDNLQVREISTSKHLLVDSLTSILEKAVRTLICLLVEEILLAKLCKWTKKLPSSPGPYIYVCAFFYAVHQLTVLRRA